jgi:molybdopterin synthase catalytic subunit
MSGQTTIRIQPAPIDIAAEIDRLAERAGIDVGAIVTFTGICRSDDGRLTALELEHYPGMAEAELETIAGDAADRWPLAGLTVVHRHGRIVPGETIVLVATASSHREAAFEAAAFMMDYLKTRAPFWKKEHLAAGGDGGWVGARTEDDTAAARWRRKAAE